MKRLTDRRAILLAAGTTTVAAVTGAVTGVVTVTGAVTGAAAAQSADIDGTIAFEGGAEIPKGQIVIYLEDSAAQDDAQTRAAKASVKSDGGSRTISFSVSLPARLAASPTREIIARLERADGWLLARGSAQPKDGAPVHIILNTVMY
jgi:uncharacterized lipoprotein YbaY